VAEAPKDDDALTRLVTQRINAVAWLNPAFVSIVAQDGVVEINGMVPSSEQRRALRILVEETPGVARVADNVRVGTVPMSA
jgi:osmotically-inducible protein OsmY